MKKRFVDPEKKVGRKRNSLYEQGDLFKRVFEYAYLIYFEGMFLFLLLLRSTQLGRCLFVKIKLINTSIIKFSM